MKVLPAKEYLNESALESSQNLEAALTGLLPAQNDKEEHERRKQIASELIRKLTDKKNNKSIDEKIELLNAAIVHPNFSSRNLGAAKRCANTLFSLKSTQGNVNPYFKSSSQEMLLKFREELKGSVPAQRMQQK